MRRQFVSNVAFYSTTAVLILIIVLCIGATVKSESRDETQRMENRIQEQQLMSDMKQYLNENGYRNSGVTLTGLEMPRSKSSARREFWIS